MGRFQVDTQQVVKWALMIAEGMGYLHQRDPPIVHRDLSSNNILMDRKGVVKIGDFGLSKIKLHSKVSNHSKIAGTPNYVAPEVVRGQPFDEKADVFAYGVLLWEMTTRKVPWADWQPFQIQFRMWESGCAAVRETLKIPEGLEPTLSSLMWKCW
ncbi:hypothetical protein CYMTET_36150 [Cymbomonas tetramitiformis]|uniref:Protein kinase domain-containing protein n=1 Tax=Cymbomonas tetramitiformis TaxID=36881 RepID=A0AAE0CGI7_9CHLO|nr:hypothetical protein CYMTET_36150 [Cymbomonas tetramitiformis]